MMLQSSLCVDKAVFALSAREVWRANPPAKRWSCLTKERKLALSDRKGIKPIWRDPRRFLDVREAGIRKSRANLYRISGAPSIETRTDSPDQTVAYLLACHNRQPADQRYGPGNGPTLSGSHQRSGGRRAGQGRGLRQRGRRLLFESSASSTLACRRTSSSVPGGMHASLRSGDPPLRMGSKR
jgi:hypothetical protein